MCATVDGDGGERRNEHMELCALHLTRTFWVPKTTVRCACAVHELNSNLVDDDAYLICFAF